MWQYYLPSLFVSISSQQTSYALCFHTIYAQSTSFYVEYTLFLCDIRPIHIILIIYSPIAFQFIYIYIIIYYQFSSITNVAHSSQFFILIDTQCTQILYNVFPIRFFLCEIRPIVLNSMLYTPISRYYYIIQSYYAVFLF